MSVSEATETSIAAASDLTDRDKGAVEALRVLARKVDALEDSGRFDNVTLPTYLKYCEALGLTPASRKAPTKPAKESKSAQSGIARRRASHLRSA